MREIVLDVPRVALDGEGVENFLWPLSWADHRAVRDAFLTGLGVLVRPGLERGNADAELLAILSMEFAQEALRGWYAAAVTRRFRELGRALVVGPKSGLDADAVGGWPRQRDRLGFLRGRFPSSRWRAALRPIYGAFRRDAFSWRHPRLVDFSRRIVATNPCLLSRVQARAIDEPVFLVSMRHWFGELCDSLPADVSHLAVSPATIDAVMALTREAAGSAGDTLPEPLVRYLRGWLVEASGIVRYYLDGLTRNPGRLPRRLWTGSGGYVFRRILHFAVRRAGGSSVSHDHGSGLGCFAIVDTNLTEFVSPDVFVTFNAAQADGYRRQRREDFRLCPRWPEIATATAAPEPRNAPPAPRGDRNVETVMFIANPYRGEEIGFTPIEFDLVAVDWQARLFRRLSGLGYRVVNKAHPDSLVRPPTAFAERLGVPAVVERFERVMDDADIYILDYLHSSVLGAVLRSGKPVLYVDFGHCPLWPEAERLFARRVRVIRGWHDEANRAHVDWNELGEAIRDARSMIADTGFADTYLAVV